MCFSFSLGAPNKILLPTMERELITFSFVYLEVRSERGASVVLISILNGVPSPLFVAGA